MIALGALAPVSPLFTTMLQAQQVAQQPRCATPVYRQFDFFIGDWDTFDLTDSTKVVARNHVSRMLDGCAVREVYDQNDGMRGESFSTYDSSRKVWHQSWVTNRGQLLLLDGNLHGASMVFAGSTESVGNKSSMVRVTWIPQHGSVRETAVISTDGGKSWQPQFDIVFRPHK
jgi:hypothetical protein